MVPTVLTEGNVESEGIFRNMFLKLDDSTRQKILPEFKRYGWEDGYWKSELNESSKLHLRSITTEIIGTILVSDK